MKLYELGTGEPVQVLVKVENASAEYDSTVAFGKEGILLIEPIRYEGKIINFLTKHLDFSKKSINFAPNC